MSKIAETGLIQIDFQDEVDSFPIRENYETLKNAHNDLENRVDGLTTTPGGTEVSDARDYAAVLRDRLRKASALQGNHVIEALQVSAWIVNNMTVGISYGTALVDGIVCVKTSTSQTADITAPSVSPRIDVVVINSDNTISVVTGAEAAVPVLPAISSTQRPLACISLTTSTTVITDFEITDCRAQGCLARGKNALDEKWFFDPQDAIDYLDDANGGTVEIAPGNYFNEYDLSDKLYVKIDASPAAHFYAPAAASCFKGTNCNNITITGGHYEGRNGGSGASTLFAFEGENFNFLGLMVDDNEGSSATSKYFTFSNGQSAYVQGQMIYFQYPTASTFPDLNFSLNGKNGIHGYLHSTSTTEATIYTALSPFLTNTGDEIPITGGSTGTAANSFMVLARAVRKDASTITVYGLRVAIGTMVVSIEQEDMRSGNSTQTLGTISIAW